jgi:hypothetical protein
MLLMAPAFSKNAPKYGARCKICSLQIEVKFQQKFWLKRTASFVAFTLSSCLCAFHKLVGEIDSSKYNQLLHDFQNKVVSFFAQGCEEACVGSWKAIQPSLKFLNRNLTKWSTFQALPL